MSSNEKMAQHLRELARNTDPRQNEYANQIRLNALQSVPPPPPPYRFGFETQLALENLNTGNNEEAVRRFQMLLQVYKETQSKNTKSRTQEIKLLHSLAISYLRQAEQDNCIAHHNADTCLFPLKGAGVHAKPEGARAAYDTYRKILAIKPRDKNAIWLMNIAAMAAGLYPKKVPKKWRIEPKRFESQIKFSRFRDIAREKGIATEGLAGGVAFDDFTGDGRMDLFVSSWGQSEQLRFYVATKDGFEERTDQANLSGLTGGLNLIHADFDNDSDNDLLVLRGAWRQEQGRIPNSLLRNDGNGKFTDVTKAAGLFEAHPTQTAVWADFDGDGWLDLFVGNESQPNGAHPCELYRNDKNGRFTDIAQKAGIAITGYVKGVTAGDFDNDGRMDIYVSRLDSTNHLFKNESTGPGHFSFREVTKTAGVEASIKTFPTWFFDYNNDGHLDLLVLGYKASPADMANSYQGLPHQGAVPHLFENQGNGRFRDRTRQRELDIPLLAMGCNFGDLDNDGWLDFYIGTGDPNFTSIMPNRMFRNHKGKAFQDITTAGGFGHLQKGHGVAFVDFDEDGDQDVFSVMGGAYEGDRFTNVLFENPGFKNNWIKLLLKGTHSNRSAIGAKIELTLGQSKLYRVVSSGGSFGSAPLRSSIGLGKATMIDKIRIRWPSGLTQSIGQTKVNQSLHIEEPKHP